MKFLLPIVFCLLIGCGFAKPLPDSGSEPYGLDVVLQDLSGQEVPLRGYRGRVILLTYWATWCFACQAEMSSLQELHEYFGDRLLIVGVAVRDSREKVKEFSRKNKLDFPILLDPEEKATCASGGDGSLPLTLILSREGKPLSFPDPESGLLVERVQGPKGWNSQRVVRALEEILAR